MRTVGLVLVSLALCACRPTASDAPAQADPAAPDAVSSAATPAASAPVRYFYFGNHVPRSVITAVEGVDTASARLVGHVTAADNRAYCLDMTGGAASSDAVARCEAENRDQPEESMTADCVARTVSDGEPAEWIRDEPADDGKVMPVWRDRASGEIRDYSGAGGGYMLTAAFRILCPAASTNIAPDPA